VRTRDGRTIEREQLVLRGSLADPMTWDELERKFRANVRGRIDAGATDEAVTRIEDLENQKTMAGLGESLLGGSR
jgi:2-methylcitrate dehydratase PrpD